MTTVQKNLTQPHKDWPYMETDLTKRRGSNANLDARIVELEIVVSALTKDVAELKNV